MGYFFLAIAIVSEVVATSSLKVSSGPKPVWAHVLVLVGYLLAFSMLRLALSRGLPLGTAYAIWAGVGVVAVALVGWRVFDESLGRAQVMGMLLVAAGVALVELGRQHE